MSDLVTITMHGLLEGQEVSSSWNYQVITGPDNPDRMTKVVSAADAALTAAWLAMLSHDYTLQQVSARDPVREAHQPSFKMWAQNPGTITEQSLPSSQAGIINISQAGLTSRNNGRIFYCGIPETAVVDQRLTVAYWSGVVSTFCAALFTNIVDADGVEYALCCLTRDRLHSPPGPPGVNLAVAVNPRVHICTQRRRMTNLLGTSAP